MKKSADVLDSIKQLFSDQVADVMADLRSNFNLDDPDEVMQYVQVGINVLGFDVGYFEGLACLSGADKTSREQAKVESIRDGKKWCLEQHESSGPCDCAQSQELYNEVYPN